MLSYARIVQRWKGERQRMSMPPVLVRSVRFSRWQRWIVDVLYWDDRHKIRDWLSVVADRLDQPGGATPTETARYTYQLLGYADDLCSTAQLLAIKGHPKGRSDLADAAIEISGAIESLSRARDALLSAAGADRISLDHDD